MRRAVANVHAYAGLPVHGKAKSRPACAFEQAQLADAECPNAVFDVDLLRKVEHVWISRSRQVRPKGQKKDAYPMVLSQILYCAQCDAAAEEAQDASRRSLLIGHNKVREKRYRHAERWSRVCGCKAKSVKAEQVDTAVFRLIQQLHVAEEYRESFTATAVQMQALLAGDTDEEVRRKMNAEAARLQLAIDNVKKMAKSGLITFEEAMLAIEKSERELKRVQMMETRKTQVLVELGECVKMLDNLQVLWDRLEPIALRELVQSLFVEISYDLDKGQITRFVLDPIADMFLVVKGTEYVIQECGTFDDPNGTRTRVLTLKG